MQEELSSFPLSSGGIEINYKDSSASGTVLGFAKRKAIFRPRLGCTLVNEISESKLRSQKFRLPPLPTTADSMPWPVGDRITKTDPNFKKQKLALATDFLFKETYKGKKPMTRAVLIVYKGNIIAEHYAEGYHQRSKFLGWSMAKSVTGALIGVLVRQGKLNITQPAPVEEWNAPSDKRHSITTEHLLLQQSGLDFVEDYSSHSNATHMLFNKGDMAGYVASLPLKQSPGTEFYYSSGNSNLLSGIVRRVVGENEYHSFPYTQLFYKLSMFHTLLEPDASGTFVGSSYIYASARDYARFGLLYLQDGIWNGERILPEDWVKKTTRAPKSNIWKNYGYQFWLNGLNESDLTKKAFPQLPDDMFMADGYGGQRIYIIPSKELVIVRMGLNKFDEQRFLRLVLDAID
jgi:CubicO group peptidase (beta-lactamase class C family)